MPIIKQRRRYKKFEYGRAPGTIGHSSFPNSGIEEKTYKVRIMRPIYKQKKTRRKRSLIHI